jgi:hypothetical protein
VARCDEQLVDGEGETGETQEMVETWTTYGSLKEVMVVLDGRYEMARCDYDMELYGDFGETGDIGVDEEHNSRESIFPDDIVKDVELGKAARPEWADWTPPRFRLVAEEGRILSQDSLTMSLRYFSCPYAKADRMKQLENA